MSLVFSLSASEAHSPLAHPAVSPVGIRVLRIAAGRRFPRLALPHLLVTLLALTGGCTPAPDNRDADGKPIYYADYADGQLLINYWAIWCEPCRKEIPELNMLAQQHPDLAVIGVSMDALDPGERSRQMRELGIQFTVLELDPADQLGYARPQVLPSTYLFEPGLKPKGVLTGPQTLASLLEALGRTER